MNIKLEKLNQQKDLQALEQILMTRAGQSDYFEVSLENVGKISLGTFNALIRMYMKFIRRGLQVQYTGCQSVKLLSLVNKTRFNDVFRQ